MGNETNYVFSPFEVRERYFAWLTSFVVDGLSQRYSFEKLLWGLFEMDFYSEVENDDNRATDGEALRSDFASCGSADRLDVSVIFERPCSVLEMLVALSLRIDDEIMWNPAKGCRSAKWFWEMVSNLGLGDLTDDVFEREDGYLRMKFAVGRMLGRTYQKDGIGGLFPLPGTDLNMRETEIWYQMNAYFLNVYGVEEEIE